MKKTSVTITESKLFTKKIKIFFSNKEREELYKYLIDNPKSGRCILESSLIRSLSWPRQKTQNCTEVDIIYLFFAKERKLYLESIFRILIG